MKATRVVKRQYQAFAVSSDGLLKDRRRDEWADRTWPHEVEADAVDEGVQKLGATFVVVPVFSVGYE